MSTVKKSYLNHIINEALLLIGITIELKGFGLCLCCTCRIVREFGHYNIIGLEW